MSLKSRKAKHRAFRDALRERKRLRKERREEQAALAVKPAIEQATAVLVAAAECYEAARRRKKGKGETYKIYLAKMIERGYTDEEARLALRVGEAARAQS